MNLFRALSIALILLASLQIASHVATANENDIDTGQFLQDIDLPFEVVKLENGFTAVVYSDHTVPSVYVGMWYGVGSKEEPKGKTGFAHLFEHLMFQGSENNPDDYFGPLSKAGASGINGTTNSDRTNYFQTVPTESLDLALWMESDRMTHFVGAIDEARLIEQKGVVQNERRNGLNRPYANTFDLIREAMYPDGHPYYHSTIGSEEDINNASLEDVRAWFRKYYGASNAVLVLAGDITAEQAREKITYYFGNAPVGEALTKKSKWQISLQNNIYEHQYANVPQSRVIRNWHAPARGTKEAVLLNLVIETLIGNENSPLQKALVEESGLAISAQGILSNQVLSSITSFDVFLRPGANSQEVGQIIDASIENYIEKGPDPDLLKNVKLSNNVAFVSAMELNNYVGRLLVEGQLYHNDPEHFKKELLWANEATADDLRLIAKEFFTKGFYQLTTEVFPTFVSKDQGVDRSQLPEIGEPTSISFPKFEQVTLDNGIKLVFAKHGALPLVDTMIDFGTGDFADTPNSIGAASATFQLLTTGTKNLDKDELSRQMAEIAMNPGTFVSGENSSITSRILTPYLERSFELLAEVITQPSFPESEIADLKTEWRSAIANANSNPSSNARAFFTKAVYGDESPNSTILSVEHVDNLTKQKIEEFYAREVTADNMTVYMVGNLELEEALSILQKTFGSWRTKNSSALRKVGDAVAPEPRVILIDQPTAIQTTILAGHAIAPFSEDSDAALGAMNEIISGGFESRINTNLREERGWSYGANSTITSNSSGDQSFFVFTTVQQDKTQESMKEILRELEEIRSENPISAEELSRVKDSSLLSLPIRFVNRSNFLLSMASSAQIGLPLDYDASEGDRISGLTLGDLRNLTQKTLDPKNLIWVIVGDLKTIEDQVRELGYGTYEVWDTLGNKIEDE